VLALERHGLRPASGEMLVTGATGGVGSVAILLDGGATVPFIARYRKEATGGLDDIQLRELEYRLGYLRELEERRAAVLKALTSRAS
jgi:uncharacterized protein